MNIPGVMFSSDVKIIPFIINVDETNNIDGIYNSDEIHHIDEILHIDEVQYYLMNIINLMKFISFIA